MSTPNVYEVVGFAAPDWTGVWMNYAWHCSDLVERGSEQWCVREQTSYANTSAGRLIGSGWQFSADAGAFLGPRETMPRDARNRAIRIMDDAVDWVRGTLVEAKTKDVSPEDAWQSKRATITDEFDARHGWYRDAF